MIVTEIRQYRIVADTKEEALYKRRSGEGDLISSQDVANLELGDKFAAVATPIALGLNLPCIDPVTRKLKQTSGCAKRRAAMNQWTTKA